MCVLATVYFVIEALKLSYFYAFLVTCFREKAMINVNSWRQDSADCLHAFYATLTVS